MFDREEYDEAINTTFVTDDSGSNWQMFMIFAVVFTIIIFSIYCTCRYHKNRNEEEEAGRFNRHYGKRVDKDDDYYRVRGESGRKAESS